MNYTISNFWIEAQKKFISRKKPIFIKSDKEYVSEEVVLINNSGLNKLKNTVQILLQNEIQPA